MNRKIIAIIVLGLVLLASLLACGYFGVKTIRRTKLRRAAMAAYENKDYARAEQLLRQYVAKDPNAEAEHVALANIYHELGNTGMEAQMWQTASSLNPLSKEYHENMLTSAIRSASYDLLHSILGRKAKMDESFTDQELYLYVISAYRSGYRKDGNDAYKKTVEANPEAFHKNDLGRTAEFMVKYSDLSEVERNDFLNQAMQSEDPIIRFEAIYTVINRTAQDGNNEMYDERIAGLLKQAMETNYFVGAPLLADYYFSKARFEDAISVAEPYLKTIDELNMYLLYAESCVFEGNLNELKELEKKLRKKSGYLPFLADYCTVLIAYLENDEERIVAAVRNSGKLVNSPLSRFIRLRVALATGIFSEIRAIAQEIFPAQPFYDLHNRASIICLDYISDKMKERENQKDPSQMAELAKIMSSYLTENRLLTEIILMDQYKKGIAKEADLLSAMEKFPDDALLMRLTAEYLIFNGKAEQALSIIEQIVSYADETEEEPNRGILFLYMLALDQVGRHEEAADIFQKLLEQSEFDLDILAQYFQYCVKNRQKDNLTSMADRLVAVQDGKLEHFGQFFRAAALLLTEDEADRKEALDILASTPTGNPEFTFYAANRLCENDRLDEAETKYKAILKTYHTPSLIHINLSIIYHARGEEQTSLEEAKEAFDLGKGSASMLPAFIYAKRLSEAKRYEEAVSILNFPHRAVNYREDIVELWAGCMHHVIEKSIADQRYMQAEDQCKHLLTIVPDDEFGKANLEKVRELLKPKKDKP